MKPNNRALKLIEMGLSAKTVLKLNENQINVLYSKLLSEAQTVTTTQVTYKPDEVESAKRQGGSLPGGKAIKVNPDNSITITKEGEIGEEKNKKKNPYAICTASIAKTAGTSKRSEWSKSDEKKYEACKKEVDESLNEGKNSVSLFLEQQIQKIVEKHIPPKITKKELMNYLSESPTTAPTKPTTKPGTKTPQKPRPAHPGKRPFEGPDPAPKAKLPSPEVAKEKVIDLIIDLITKNEK